MARKRNQHVVPAKDGWAVKPAGSPKAAKVFETQRDGHIWPGLPTHRRDEAVAG
ncbi:DUF2188 domain-containing protein [Candidatus Palauibacter sp.]|uniref:DUF2188 domain-containing protein n=1 Tax=Candidatus Palauibacter sp. TaxID=3101350 RepID=UPI003B528692